ncbi:MULTISPECIES: DUF3040 domain-containing protein [unclassified Actinomyces]|uniref:DUF3040 domain-containing protein n=1 Tax=unclassified Actinomyces TaxID=2609248 RepID=UPI0013742826|nr:MULTISPECIES: DUF3040 domain-containing protein [unclassified Actinomyces]MBW3069722.1 DUF3040 domain-containing protein [Actinomyces sp. 594]NDR52751.1 DUF3040 domain-containing protein [Actinomyces sp. 565]QHO91238.1 hypothetical protein CWT12_07820 [Actinomyces sp. 432]
MALSEREQQVLRDLEEQLNDEDPSLAETMQHADTTLRRPSPRRIGAGVALLLVGLAVVIAGVAIGNDVVSIALGVLGFALAVWGVTLMLTRGGAGEPKTPRSAGRSSFMQRQSERWDRRRDGQN